MRNYALFPAGRVDDPGYILKYEAAIAGYEAVPAASVNSFA